MLSVIYDVILNLNSKTQDTLNPVYCLPA